VFETLAAKSSDSLHLIDSTIVKPTAPPLAQRREQNQATRIAMLFDKLPQNFLAATALVGALYWIKL
jgi:hypothetical protein